MALIPLAFLAACATSTPERGRAVTPAPVAEQPRIGVVESASVVSLASTPSATAGGTAGAATSPTMAYRVKLPDGSTQSVVQQGERFAVGDRVKLTGEGRLARP